MASPHVMRALGLLKAQNPIRDWLQLKNLIIAGFVPFDSNNQPTISNRRLRLTDIDGRGSMSCNNQKLQARLRPIQNVVDVVNSNESRVGITYLNINCGQAAGNVILTVRETGQQIVLLDDGNGTDQAQGDGIYSGNPVLFDLDSAAVNIDFPNGDVLQVHIKPSYVVSSPTYQYQNLECARKNLYSC